MMAAPGDVRSRLAGYEALPVRPARRNDLVFFALLMISLVSTIGCGIFLRSLPPLPKRIVESVIHLKQQYVTLAQPPVKKEKPKETPKPKAEEPELLKEPIDLTQKPPVPSTEQAAPDQSKPAVKTPVRAVYGLRRVFATGIGSGGSMSDAVIGKVGNTINKNFDTVVATLSEVKGTVVSTVTITTSPKFRKVVKPVYTPEMLQNSVAGTVKVKVLIDIDGKVKKAVPQNDLGFGTAKAAADACLAMEFDPAMRGAEAVAVWILIPVTFVLLN